MIIRRSLSWARLKGEAMRPRYFPPKTRAGRRTISLPALLASDLKPWKLQCPQSEEGFVFPAPDGKPACRDWLLRAAFYPALARGRLRRVTFHTLRHSCASAMIAAALQSPKSSTGSATPTRQSRYRSTRTSSNTPRAEPRNGSPMISPTRVVWGRRKVNSEKVGS
ncbi:MAG: hypothetical protein ABSG46_00195 [Candidatus Binataceae bacterium]